jgi:hypothetical protein
MFEYESVEMQAIRLLISWCLIFIIFFLIISTYLNTNYDRRDVNRDGEINLVDLSVLSVEIQNQK